MKLIIAILVLFTSVQLFSQQKEPEFGKFSREELWMKTYEKDPYARAVVLYDKGKSVFLDTDEGFIISYTRHRRTKIFDKTETRHAEVSIPYYVHRKGEAEAVISIEAATYNITDGKLTQKRVMPSAIYEERINEWWYIKKFVFPDVQDGAILEYRYVMETPFHFNLPDWRFQDDIPTLYSEYQVSMIPFYEYVFVVNGISGFDYSRSKLDKEKRMWGSTVFQDKVHTYVLKDVPAFRDESYITSVNDYIIKMDFQLSKVSSPRTGTKEIISTWPALNAALLKNDRFGKYLKKSGKIAKKILKEELNVEALDNRQKAEKIIDYVKNNFEWNGYYNKYASQSPDEFFDKKRGNVGDINLFMIALLNEAEIPAEPLILSTRNHGKIPSEYPYDQFTNYVIAKVDTDSPFLADGTEEYLPYNKLPLRCNNEKGLIVNKDKEPIWISLNNEVLSIEKNLITLTLDTVTTDITALISNQNTEYEALASRRAFQDDSTKIREYYGPKVGEIQRLKTSRYEQSGLPYSINFETKYETEKLGNNVVIRPFLKLPLSKNTLTQKVRRHPIDFVHPWEKKFESRIKVPEGFVLAELPEGMEVDDELAEIRLNYSFVEGVLVVKGNYKFKNSIYNAEDYAQIKHYMDQVVKYFNQPVVLEKIN